eukprot:CAMPEP_0119123464 /NCGR_PEP_ID=MMETSP1310-20130426/3403_1 /TAXON_ID=464262 /ORGANISM="Genus nov. species nov., Strain RCC2339" /LENGTH=112 /DNA_ID=CAMNT_0007113295 /DNA_START=58 /DNA_END=396 /DNA_ORIENTATION=-
MVQRVTLRRRHAYATRSNKIKIVKTPGGKLTVQYRAKLAKGVKCGDCGNAVSGIAHMRPMEATRVSKRQKHVSRAYGGNVCGGCVRQRIVRAFLIEEQQNVKRVLKQKKAQK